MLWSAMSNCCLMVYSTVGRFLALWSFEAGAVFTFKIFSFSVCVIGRTTRYNKWAFLECECVCVYARLTMQFFHAMFSHWNLVS